jgi:hypothetical protein
VSCVHVSCLNISPFLGATFREIKHESKKVNVTSCVTGSSPPLLSFLTVSYLHFDTFTSISLSGNVINLHLERM